MYRRLSYISRSEADGGGGGGGWLGRERREEVHFWYRTFFFLFFGGGRSIFLKKSNFGRDTCFVAPFYKLNTNSPFSVVQINEQSLLTSLCRRVVSLIRQETLFYIVSLPGCINGYRRSQCWGVTLRWTSIPSRRE